MSKFVRAVSLRIGGFLVVLGGFLIFASASSRAPLTPVPMVNATDAAMSP